MSEKSEVKVKECEWCGSLFSTSDLSATACSDKECVEDREDVKAAEALAGERSRARQREIEEARADLAKIGRGAGEARPLAKGGADLYEPAIRMLQLAQALGRDGHEEIALMQAGSAYVVLKQALEDQGLPLDELAGALPEDGAGGVGSPP